MRARKAVHTLPRDLCGCSRAAAALPVCFTHVREEIWQPRTAYRQRGVLNSTPRSANVRKAADLSDGENHSEDGSDRASTSSEGGADAVLQSPSPDRPSVCLPPRTDRLLSRLSRRAGWQREATALGTPRDLCHHHAVERHRGRTVRWPRRGKPTLCGAQHYAVEGAAASPVPGQPRRLAGIHPRRRAPSLI